MSITQSSGVQKDITSIVQETYRAIFNKDLADIEIEVLPEQEFKEKYRQRRRKEPKNVGGYVLHKNGEYLVSVSEEKSIADTVVKIGHEIAHVHGPLPRKSFNTKMYVGKILEEAKAYSFQNLWAETIRRYNIGNLRSDISKANEELLRDPLHSCPRAGPHYIASLLVSLFDFKKPGRLYSLLSKVPHENGILSRLLNPFICTYVS